MKLNMFLLLFILLFSCGKKDVEFASEGKPAYKKQQSKIKAIEIQSSKIDLTINSQYLTIGYFDENNILIKIERFLDGIKLD